MVNAGLLLVMLPVGFLFVMVNAGLLLVMLPVGFLFVMLSEVETSWDTTR